MSRFTSWFSWLKLLVGDQRQYVKAKSEKIERYPGDMASDLAGSGSDHSQRGRSHWVSDIPIEPEGLERASKKLAGKVFKGLMVLDDDVILEFQDGSKLWIKSNHHFNMVVVRE